MKKVVNKYHNHKFCRCINGLIFGAISFGSIAYCTNNLIESGDTNIGLPFLLAIVSLVMGMFTMFKRYRVSNKMV